ncbi:hypothetical protein HDU93_002260 [Gonapodya sp. JEL0774]|nr:hypothetical protein HDU93_002260 [Gonapodya sp. JEL0774]
MLRPNTKATIVIQGSVSGDSGNSFTSVMVSSLKSPSGSRGHDFVSATRDEPVREQGHGGYKKRRSPARDSPAYRHLDLRNNVQMDTEVDHSELDMNGTKQGGKGKDPEHPSPLGTADREHDMELDEDYYCNGEPETLNGQRFWADNSVPENETLGMDLEVDQHRYYDDHRGGSVDGTGRLASESDSEDSEDSDDSRGMFDMISDRDPNDFRDSPDSDDGSDRYPNDNATVDWDYPLEGEGDGRQEDIPIKTIIPEGRITPPEVPLPALDATMDSLQPSDRDVQSSNRNKQGGTEADDLDHRGERPSGDTTRHPPGKLADVVVAQPRSFRRELGRPMPASTSTILALALPLEFLAEDPNSEPSRTPVLALPLPPSEDSTSETSLPPAEDPTSEQSLPPGELQFRELAAATITCFRDSQRFKHVRKMMKNVLDMKGDKKAAVSKWARMT